MTVQNLSDFRTLFTPNLSEKEKQDYFKKNQYEITGLALRIANQQLDQNDPIDFSIFYQKLHPKDYEAIIKEITSQLLQTRSPTTYSTTLAALEHSLANLKRRNNFNFAFLSSFFPSLITIEQTKALCNYITNKINLVKPEIRKLKLQFNEKKQNSAYIPDLSLDEIEAALRKQEAKLEQSKVSMTTLCENLIEARPEVRLTAIEYLHNHIENENDFRAIVNCLRPIECRLVQNTEKTPTPKLRTLITSNQNYQTIINEKISSAARDEDPYPEDRDDRHHANGDDSTLGAQETPRTPTFYNAPSAADVIKFYNILRLEGFAKFFQSRNRWSADSSLREMYDYKNSHPTSRTAEAWKLAAYAINHPEDQNGMVIKVIQARMRSSRFATVTLLGTHYFKADSVAAFLGHTGNHEAITALGGDIVKIRQKLGFSS